MAKSKWFKVNETVEAQFELGGKVLKTTIQKGSFIEVGTHPKQVLLENGDIMWGLTQIPSSILSRSRG